MSTQAEVDEKDWERDNRGFRVVPDVDDAYIHAASDPMSDFVDLWAPEKPIDRQRWMTSLRKAVSTMQDDAAGATIVAMTAAHVKAITEAFKDGMPQHEDRRADVFNAAAAGVALGFALFHLLDVLLG